MVTPGTEREGTGGGEVYVIAHRGFAGVNVENTRSAFESASRDPSVDAVELDVMPTADGEVVVFHDETLRRVTDAPEAVSDRNVWEFDYADLRRFTVLDSGQPIPRLEDVLDAVPPSVDVNVEFKHPGRPIVERGPLDSPTLADQRTAWRPFVEDVVAVLEEYDHEFLCSSFHEGAVAATRDVAPSLPIGWVFYDGVEAGLTVARRHDVEYFHLPLNMVVGTSLFDKPYAAGPYEPVDLLEVAREEGRAVNVWTVRAPQQAVELARAGVDGLITDVPWVHPEAEATGAAEAVDGTD